MTHEERIERLMHSASNCTHMLHAIDRKMADALVCLEEGRDEECKRLIAQLKDALPQAIAVLDFEK